MDAVPAERRALALVVWVDSVMEGEPEAYVDDSLRSIGISPRERLARIEALLVTIDDKLSSKASQVDMLALEVRIRKIETEGSVHAREAVEEARRLAREREEDLIMLTKEYRQLRSDHEGLGRKIAWAFGALAVAAVGAEAILAHWLG